MTDMYDMCAVNFHSILTNHLQGSTISRFHGVSKLRLNDMIRAGILLLGGTRTNRVFSPSPIFVDAVSQKS